MPLYATFYIDPDDEIPSFVARMKSTRATFLVFVVPQRAILFSSIITMRLLKKEAERLEKDVFLVTQDEAGFEMARRTGYIVRRTVEEIPFLSENRETEILKKTSAERASLDFSTHAPIMDSSREVMRPKFSEPARSVANSLLGESREGGNVVPVTVNTPIRPYTKSSSETSSDREIGSSVWGDFREENKIAISHLREEKSSSVLIKKDSGGGEKNQVLKEIKKEDFVKAQPKERSTQGTVGSKMMGIAAFSFLGILGMFGGIFLLVQKPEAKVIVHPKSETVSGDVNYLASVDAGKIETKFFEFDDAATTVASATGATLGAGSKSHGTVTLYNTFSADAQPLVATTRLQTAEGKIFRITRSVSIPGFQEKEGKVEPGTVEVEVLADATGSEYDISATKFIIPGFSNGEKQEKIYAQSASVMTGGGISEEKSRLVTQGDIASAKKKIEQEMKLRVLERAKTDMDFGTTSEDLIEVTFTEESAVPTIGTVTEKFDLNVKVHVRYAVFSERDAKKVAIGILLEKQVPESAGGLEEPSITLEYGKMVADFTKKTIDMKMFVSGSRFLEVPVEAIRTEILGKTEADLQSVIDAYPQVQGFEIEIQKSYFEKRIPADPDKVIIDVAK